MSVEDLNSSVSQHEAIRYLNILTIINDKVRSNFSSVDEEESCIEDASRNKLSIDGQVNFHSNPPIECVKEKKETHISQ